MSPNRRRRLTNFFKNLKASKEIEQEKQLPNALKEIKVEEKPIKKYLGKGLQKEKVAEIEEKQIENKEISE